MSDRILELRKKGLEEAFFAKHNQELLERLRKKLEAEARRGELVALSGIRDPQVLEELVELGLGSETLAALGLVPLLEVAWADGKVQTQERAALLEAARKEGIEPDAPAWELLSGWLEHEPDPGLFTAWKDYVRALRGAVSEDSFAALRAQVMNRATAVARAAGGIVGVGSVWGVERNVLEQLEAAFDES